jgi:asparagine synthase (glutamine-hydrolysing)
MLAAQRHRGPDGSGTFESSGGRAWLGHNRLAIIDLSDGGRQPMASADGNRRIVFNGEIYNYRELARELAAGREFRSASDTEVLLAAYDAWGTRCLDRLLGMFAFAIWDEGDQTLWAARDRFGVKPLYYASGPEGELLVASEVRAIHAAGLAREPDEAAWASYLVSGASDFSERTFWKGIAALPPGHEISWKAGRTRIRRWYDLAESVGTEIDVRSEAEVEERYRGLLSDSVALRFRSDVPVAINVSGGLDSSTLLGLVQEVRGPDDDISAFTFSTGDPRYDEIPWVRAMLERTRHPLVDCRLEARDVPALAASVAEAEDEPFGGVPTLAYARLFEEARSRGVIVLLDGQGMDEQWAGYDYYRGVGTAPLVQGTRESPVRPETIVPDFRSRALSFSPPAPFPDRLRNLQYRDLRYSKIPRALRFNDRASMRASTELREPFLDHRLVELAFRQPADRKISGDTGKWLLRKISAPLLPGRVSHAPKRPVQTPQREWLRGPLREWADACIEDALAGMGASWLDPAAVRRVWKEFARGSSDNSFYVWQWVNLGLLSARSAARLPQAVNA